MRVRVVGAGGVGGVIGGLLAHHGVAVELVARGAHADAIARDGLTVELPSQTLHVRSSPVEPDLVVLAVKSNDTAEALTAVPPGLPVFCAQNGVANERLAEVRHEAHGVMVWLPAAYVGPGVVRGHGADRPGALRLGRWPSGIETIDGSFAAALRDAGFDAQAVPEVSRWKYAKLLANLGNIVDAAIVPGPEARKAAEALWAEGAAVLDAAQIAVEELRVENVGYAPVGASERAGGSTFQSLTRGLALETPFLNGEIVEIGARVGVPTPLNEAAVALANRVREPRSVPASDLL